MSQTPSAFELAIVLENALRLVFLQFQFAGLAGRMDGEKMVNAVQKTWKEMTPAARQHAPALALGRKERALLRRPLEDG